MTLLGARTTAARRGVGLVLVALAVAACSSGTDRAATTSPTRPEVLEARTIRSGGVDRAYGLFVPGDAGARPPLVVVVHLYLIDAPAAAATGGGSGASMVAAARREGFAMAALTGVDFSFNAGTCCGTAVRQGLDDIGFVDDVIADVVRRDGVDASRVYLVGFSNGAFLAYEFACERPDRIAGAAIVEGALLAPACRPSRPVDLLVLHQQGDETVPVDGTDAADIPGNPVPLPSVTASLTEYLRGAGCPTRMRTTTTADEERRVVRCDGKRIESIVHAGGAHTWPEGDFSGTRAVTRFFDLERAP